MRAPVLAVAVLLGVAASADAQLAGQTHVEGLSAPVAFVQDPFDATIQFIVQQEGVIRVVHNGAVLGPPFLDLTGDISTGGERGLLGMAISPVTNRVFVNFTNTSGHTVIARFARASAVVADVDSRFDLVWSPGQAFITQPASNHNGGNLVFGPDGYLYIGLGDGGGANDTAHHAQNPTSLLGKMLRIDVNVADGDTEGYDIPADNPFIDNVPVDARQEIWAFGLRNPWKYSFDSATGALIIADVGQSQWEEINYEPPGRGARNYGWRNYEGSRANVQSQPLAYLPPTMPAFEYDHSEGGSVSGGYVYRGTALHTSFRGRYFFADFISGRVWSLRFDLHPTTGEATAADLREHTAELSDTGLGLISGFGVDSDGELYVVGYSTGRIVKIVGTGAALSAAPPQPASDLNDDLLPDLVWQHETQGYIASWLMNGTTLIDSVLTHPNRELDSDWKIVAAPFINRDFKSDIVWQHQTQGYVALWMMNGRTLIESVLFEPGRVSDTDWKIVASGDINGDGKTDLIWRHQTDGWIAAWLLDGIRLVDSVLLSPTRIDDTLWNIVGTGDFNADGRADLVWHHRTEGHVVVWLMNGTTLMASVATSVDRVSDTGWVIAGVWDPNRDGKADILWQHRTDGYVATWLMNGLTVADSVLLSPARVTDTGWRIAGPR